MALDSPRRPTVHDVARVAGVSHATVSRHLNGHSNVAPGTAAAIDAAVAQVRYVPNRTARQLVRRTTQTVALIVREHVDLFYSDPTLSRMAAGANAMLAQRGYLMPLMLVDTPQTEDRVIDMVLGGSVDGALLVAMMTDDRVAQALRGAQVPLVTASTPFHDDDIAWVDTDNKAGMEQIARLLKATGRTVMAEIRGPVSAPVSEMRHQGFVAAAGRDYVPELVVDAAEWSFDAGAFAMRTLLDRGLPFTGLVVASDLLAAGAMSVLHASGLRVPGDVAVVGFDDSPAALMTVPAISTVRQDSRTTGNEMAALLLRLIAGESVANNHVVVPSQVVWRDSAGPMPPQ